MPDHESPQPPTSDGAELVGVTNTPPPAAIHEALRGAGSQSGGDGAADEEHRPATKKPREGGAPLALVGIGASAGGVQVLQELFGKMAPDTNLAFVVVMHLSPEHESNLAAILQRETSMRVTQVTEPTTVVPNHVYVIPPDKYLTMRDSDIIVVDPQKIEGRRVAIDLFFRTLAEQYGQRCACIVLSGTDSDGVIGLKHVKAQGGVTIAQEPSEAEHSSMPRSAIETGMVDWVLPVDQMADRLAHFARNEMAMRLPREHDGVAVHTLPDLAPRGPGGPMISKPSDDPEDEAALHRVLTFLRAQTGHDFTQYKRATVLRRIARRLQVNGLESVREYLEFMRTHAPEPRALLNDLLIGVTHFFRDQAAWQALESHIPQLFAGRRSNEQIRAWVAGCASGEEAYSLAILLLEHAAMLDNPPQIQVFATDLDEDSVRIAREGLFPLTIEADVSPERLRRFFFQQDGRYRVKKEVRELVLFADHDLLRDAPFSRLDIATCRNLLIYLRPEAQHRVMDIFHFALKPGGMLFVGGSENLDDNHALFSPLDKKHRIFTRRSVLRAPLLPMAPFTPPRRQAPVLPRLATPFVEQEFSPGIADVPLARQSEAATETHSPADQRIDSLAKLHSRLLEQHAPPSVLVDEKHNILHISTKAAAFLHFHSGEPSSNLLKAVDDTLRVELRTALFRASQGEEEVVVHNIPYERDGTRHAVTLHVYPAAIEGDTLLRGYHGSGAYTENLFLVLLDDVPLSDAQATHGTQEHESVAVHLESEIERMRAQLTATTQQYDASVEELKASNEELQAMNEELRSAGEELETSREELQSINEELSTVNAELKLSFDELTRTNSDLQNLMSSTDIGTVFLDKHMRVKRFTPRAKDLFNLIDADVGRSISDITNKLAYPELMDDAERVMRDLVRVEREVKRRDNGWFIARLLPYRTVDDKIDGAVLTFVDITERKVIENRISESEEQFRRAIEEAPIPVIMHAEDGRVLQISRTWTELTGYTPEDINNFDAWLNQAYGPGATQVRGHMHELFSGNRRSINIDFPITTRSGEVRHWSFSASAPGTLRDGRRFIIGMAVDVTERTRAEEARRLSEQRLQRVLETEDVGVVFFKHDGMLVDANEPFLKMTGYSREEVRSGKISWRGLTPPEFLELTERQLEKLAETGKIWPYEKQYILADGTRRWMLFTGRDLGDGTIAEFVLDIHDRKNAEVALRDSEERYRRTLEIESVAVIFFKKDGQITDANTAFHEWSGYTREDVSAGKLYCDEMTAPEFRERTREAMAELERTGRTTTYEKQYIRKDGTRWWGLFSATKLNDDLAVKFIVDVSDRKRGEADLRSSEERFRNVADHVPQVIWTNDRKGAAVYFNKRFFDYTGLSYGELRGPGWQAVVHPDDAAGASERWQHALAKGEIFEMEYRLRRHDGTYRWFIGRNVPLRADRKVVSWFGSATDIDDFKRAEAARRESEERFRVLVEGAKDYAMFLLNLDNVITYWSTGAERVFGWSREEAEGQSGELIFIEEDKTKGEVEKEIGMAMQEGRAPDRRWHLRKNRKRVWIDGVMMRLDNADGSPRGFAKIARDASEQKDADEALRHARDQLEQRVLERTAELIETNERLRNEAARRQKLEAEILEVTERERARISQDLHDSLCQELTATAFLLKSHAKVVGRESATAADSLREAAETVNANAGLARDLARGLHPPELGTGGLVSALRELASRTNERVTCRCDCPRALRVPDEQIAVNLYRIAQEAVLNALKHAKPNEIVICIERDKNEIVLAVSDDGKSKRNAKKKGGLGIQMMQYRASVCRGSLTVERRWPHGTKVTCRIPVKK